MTGKTKAGQTGAKQRRSRAALAAALAAGLCVLAQAAALAQTEAPPASPTHRMFLSVRAGDMPGLEQSLLEGANTAARNAEGLSALELAGELGRFGMAQMLRMQPPAPPGAENRVIEEIPYQPPSAAAPAGFNESAAARMISTAEIVVDLAETDPFGAASLGIEPLDQPTALAADAAPPAPASAPAPSASAASAPEPGVAGASGEAQIAASPKVAAQTAAWDGGGSEGFFSRLRRTLSFDSDDEEKTGPEPAAEAETVQTAAAPAYVPPPEPEMPPELTSDEVLALPALTIGAAPNLGRALAVSGDALHRSCVSRRRGAVVVCLETLDWPAPLAAVTGRGTGVIRGSNSIVRYDGGAATRYHALFPADAYETVKEYYISKYGLPSEDHNWRISLITGRAPNHAVLWSNINPADQSKSWLEIRRHDDTRGGFPDSNNGVLMLYNTGGGPVFPQVSIYDLSWLRPVGAPAYEDEILQPLE